MLYEREIQEYLKGSVTSIEKGRMFLKWVLINLFSKLETECENESLSDGVLNVDGGGDHGIDAAFKEYDVLYIIQAKYGSSHKPKEVNSFFEEMNLFLSDNSYQCKNESIQIKLNKIKELINADESEINQIKFYYITNNYIDGEKKSGHYSGLKIKDSGKFKCSFEVIGLEDFKNIECKSLFSLPSKYNSEKSNILVKIGFQNKDSNTIVAETTLDSIFKLVKNAESYIYKSNVRDYLGGSTTVNKEIKETLRSNDVRNFWFYNNGITIVCNDYNIAGEDKKNIENKYVTMYGAQIINGCQTSRTIHDYIYSDEFNRKSQDEQQNIKDNSTILVKIIRNRNNNVEKSKITRYTNTQNPVTGKDLFAIDEYHKRMAREFSKIGYNYEIQKNSMKNQANRTNKNMLYEHLFDQKFKKHRKITAKEITQTYVAGMMNKPGESRNSISKYMPGGTYYDKVYCDWGIDVLTFLFPYATFYNFSNRYNELSSVYNGKIEENDWKTSRLLLTSIFFMILKKVYDFNENDFDNIAKTEFIEKIKFVFENKNIFDLYLKSSVKVLSDFYYDSSIKSKKEESLVNFLKTPVDKQENVDILVSHIERVVESIKNQVLQLS